MKVLLASTKIQTSLQCCISAPNPHGDSLARYVLLKVLLNLVCCNIDLYALQKVLLYERQSLSLCSCFLFLLQYLSSRQTIYSALWQGNMC